MAAQTSPPSRLTQAYMIIFSLRALALFLPGKGDGSGALTRAEILSAITQTVLVVAGIGVGLVWLHRAWSRVPEDCRIAYDGRRVQPDEAIWKLFIPVYGLYWLFIANIGLCGALERQLKRARARVTEGPSTLALITCLVELVPIVNLAAPLLWAILMMRIDAAQTEAERLDPEAIVPPRWGRAVLLAAGGIVALFGMLIGAFLAIWMFLNPGAPARDGAGEKPPAAAQSAAAP
jgi:hypothetical protein